MENVLIAFCTLSVCVSSQETARRDAFFEGAASPRHMSQGLHYFTFKVFTKHDA